MLVGICDDQAAERRLTDFLRRFERENALEIEGDMAVLRRLVQYAAAFTNTFSIIEP